MTIEFKEEKFHSTETVEKTARLSRLELKSEEVELFSQQLGGILSHIDTLNEINTDGIEPLVHPWDGAMSLREDELNILGSKASEVIACAAESLNDGYKVPQVISS